jgi:hypothetical protein
VKHTLYIKIEEGGSSQQGINQSGKKKQYRKICFKETIYEVGDTLLFRETESTNVVGKLVKIIPEGGNP